MTAELLSPATRFALPDGAEATGPPERRGLSRDGVRQLVVRPDRIEHRRFHELPGRLRPGDIVVINTSATMPAALDAVRQDGSRVGVHVSAVLDEGDCVVEVRRGDGSGPETRLSPGEELILPGGIHMRLIWPHPDVDALTSRLWHAELNPEVDVPEYLARHGRPIGYRYLTGRFPLAEFQTVYATEPGSAEMPSAGRPFTPELIVRLVARGIAVAPVVLHAGVSSAELPEPPCAERFAVPAPTARQVNAARAAGGRVVAVGTTAVRALESAADTAGSVHASQGWTDLLLGPGRPVRVVDGLVTGLHEPRASHLLLLEAVAGAELVGAAYAEAVRARYLWHEFGDSMLFLP